MNWLLIITFNIIFGLASGYITSRIFHRRDNGRWFSIDKSDKQMILCVSISSALVGILFYAILPRHQAAWIWLGLNFGNIIPITTVTFIYLSDLYSAIVSRAKSAGVPTTRLERIRELWQSFKGVEIFIVALFTFLYGWISLLVPVLGLAWGYITYNYLIFLK